jgi:hypothetical protein
VFGHQVLYLMSQTLALCALVVFEMGCPVYALASLDLDPPT